MIRDNQQCLFCDGNDPDCWCVRYPDEGEEEED
jgi:hypothetical protein